jgi:hypothetical protein
MRYDPGPARASAGLAIDVREQWAELGGDAGPWFVLENAVAQYVFEEKCVAEEAGLHRPGRKSSHCLALQDGLPTLGNPEIEDHIGCGQKAAGPGAHGPGRAEFGLQLAKVGDRRVGAHERPIGEGIAAAAQRTERDDGRGGPLCRKHPRLISSWRC